MSFSFGAVERGSGGSASGTPALPHPPAREILFLVDQRF